jgi:hypothetical protein
MAADEVASVIGTGTPLSVTVASGTDRYLVVFIECSTTPTMARDGQSLTQLHEYSNDGLRYAFGLAAPNTGTADVVVTGGGTISGIAAVVLTDVDQSSPVVASASRQWNGASPWTPSAVTSETNGYVMHFGFVTNTTISASAPTELLAEVDTGTYRYFVVGRASAGTSTSTSFTVASPGGAGESILLSLREATGGGGGGGVLFGGLGIWFVSQLMDG